ncbi:hypothetical protein CAEBREN_12652 [Caenorhabditis brenneri]|uniref:Uncharacterized protein n=1 Tax=Caenorhabditis brenneri TaxID=135651 RepID=G0P890_CAEBE|nr:hypothetical protein CAEBREN_12652 [Caenorhabditis brenneri]
MSLSSEDHIKDKKNYILPKVEVPPGKYEYFNNRDKMLEQFQFEPMSEEEDYEGYKYVGPKVKEDICKYNPLYLVVEPECFVIDPEKGTMFSIKNPSKNAQDVIVTCHSFMFEIKEARRKLGITSQWFHVIGKDETKTFHIVMKDAKDESLDNFQNSPYNWASGVFEITHYKSRISGSYTKPKVTDSDKEWGIEGSNLLIRTACNSDHYQGYYFHSMHLKFENEESKKRKYRFMELIQARILSREVTILNEWKGDQKMFTDEDIGYRKDDYLGGFYHDHVPDNEKSVRPVVAAVVEEHKPEQEHKAEVVEKKKKKKKWSLMNFLKKKPK